MSRIFGNPAQLGYVVRDIDKAMDEWIERGVGPWFYFGAVETDYFRHRGEDSDMQMSVALANSGDLQIELIQPRNDAPSMYKEFLDSGNEGFQHISYWSTDYDGLYEKVLGEDWAVGHEGCIGGELGRFAYFEKDSAPGLVIEISDVSGPKGQFFEHVRDEAANWDGTEAIRRLN